MFSKVKVAAGLSACAENQRGGIDRHGPFENFGNCVVDATNRRDALPEGWVCAIGNEGNLILRERSARVFAQRKWPAKAGHFASDASA
jgi:hypothetical protein